MESKILKTGFKHLVNREISAAHAFENKICTLM